MLITRLFKKLTVSFRLFFTEFNILHCLSLSFPSIFWIALLDFIWFSPHFLQFCLILIHKTSYFLEPISSLAPKINDDDRTKQATRKSNNVLSLNCLSQAYPAPLFRLVLIFCVSFCINSVARFTRHWYSYLKFFFFQIWKFYCVSLERSLQETLIDLAVLSYTLKSELH